MSRFLRALSKIGLVEFEGDEAASPEPAAEADDAPLSDAELAAFLAEEDAGPARVEADTVSPGGARDVPDETRPMPTLTGGDPSIDEGRALDTIYTAASIAPSPYPAEKMLRVLDGLKAMDPATRKAAILAMDAADEAWTIDDPLLDADRKTRALRGAQQTLADTLAAAETRADQEIKAQDEQQAATVAEIKQSITELEQLMAQAIGDATARKEEIKSQLDGTRGAVARETARFEAEIDRLAQLGQTFGQIGSK